MEYKYLLKSFRKLDMFKRYFVFIFLISLTQIQIIGGQCSTSSKIKDDSSCFNGIIRFGGGFRAGQFTVRKDGILYIEYSSDRKRLFFSLKPNGRGTFTDDATNKEIEVETNSYYQSELAIKRYESKNRLVYLSSDSTQSNPYIFSVSSYKGLTELHYFDNEGNNNHKTWLTTNFFGISEQRRYIFSYQYSLIEGASNTYYAAFIQYKGTNDKEEDYSDTYTLSKIKFNSITSYEKNIKEFEDNYDNRIVSAFIMEKYNVLVVFFLKKNPATYKFRIHKLDNLDQTNEIEVYKIANDQGNDNVFPGEGIYFKGLYLRHEYVAIIFFTEKDNGKSLVFQILYVNADYSFAARMTKYINTYDFSTSIRLNELYLINYEKLLFVSTIYQTKLVLMFLDMCDWYNYLNVRIYKFDMDNYYFNKEIAVDYYNNFLMLTSTVSPNGGDVLSSFLLFFGYPNGTDFSMNISPYVTNSGYYVTGNNLISYLLSKRKIENNIFGYTALDEIKLISIPVEILFYKSGSSVALTNGQNIDSNNILEEKKDLIKYDRNYILDYQYMAKGKAPSNDLYNQAHEKMSISNSGYNSPKFGDSGYYSQNTYYGRTNRLTFRLCHEYCETCKELGNSNNNQKCLTCLPQYRYDYYNYFNIYPENCVPQDYFNDLGADKKIVQCTASNSKFYYNISDSNKRICFDKEKECPDTYSFLNITTNECLNYTPPIPTTIPKIPTTIPKIPTTIPMILTTILKIPTTIPKIPTTIPKIPTTIPIIPTTIPKIPTTIPIIPTTIPKIPTTIPIIPTTIPKIPTTIPMIPTTIIKIPTTIPKIPTTIPIIPTTIPIIPTTIPKIPTTIPIIPTTISIIPTTILKAPNTLLITPTTYINLIDTIINQIPTTIVNVVPSTVNSKIPTSILKPLITTNPTTIINKPTTIVENVPSTAPFIKSSLPEIIPITTLSTTDLGFKTTIANEISTTITKIIPSTIYNDKCLNGTFITNFCSNISDEVLYSRLRNEIFDSYASNKEAKIYSGKADYSFRVSNTNNEMRQFNFSSGFSIIDLGECENLLKQANNIPLDSELIILKKEKINAEPSDKDVEFDIYHPFTYEKLDKSICDNIIIDLYVPLQLSEEHQKYYNQLIDQGYNPFDLGDKFYREICTPYNSENGTDVLLDDREEFFYYPLAEQMVCQNNCQYSSYSLDTKYMKCECGNNKTTVTLDLKHMSKENVLQSFLSTFKSTNYKVMRCYNLVFNFKIFLKNYGSMITLIFFIVYILFMIHYCRKDIYPLRVEISKLLFNSSENEKMNEYNKFALKSYEKPKIAEKIRKTGKKVTNKKGKNPPKKQNAKKITNISDSSAKSPDSKLIIFSKSSRTNLKKQSTKIQKKTSTLANKNNKEEKKKPNTFESKSSDNNLEKEEGKITQNEKVLDNFELNDLDYDEACELDKRGYCKTYWSVLMREHLLLFTFFSCNDYNLFYIKIERFFTLMCIEMTVNGLFFVHESMHRKYVEGEEFTFVQKIPQLLFTLIASHIIEVILCFMGMTDTHIYEINALPKFEKNSEKVIDINDRMKNR